MFVYLCAVICVLYSLKLNADDVSMSNILLIDNNNLE